MTIKMQALNRFHYPSGTLGRDYKAGDEFEALSDRDVKALTLLRRAKAVEVKPFVEPYKPRPKAVEEPVKATAEWEIEKPRRSTDDSKPTKVTPMSTADMPSETQEGRHRRSKKDESGEE